MPHKRAKVGQTLAGEGDFDTSEGVYRDLSTGKVGGPGAPAPRTLLQRLESDAAKGGRKFLHELSPSTWKDWGGYVYGTRKVGRGKDAIVVPKIIPYKPVAIIGGVIVAAWMVERIMAETATWWPGSSGTGAAAALGNNGVPVAGSLLSIFGITGGVTAQNPGTVMALGDFLFRHVVPQPNGMVGWANQYAANAAAGVAMAASSVAPTAPSGFQAWYNKWSTVMVLSFDGLYRPVVQGPNAGYPWVVVTTQGQQVGLLLGWQLDGNGNPAPLNGGYYAAPAPH